MCIQLAKLTAGSSSLAAAGHHVHGQVEVSASDHKDAESVVGPSHEHAHSHEELHAFIGVSLVMGFVFMLLVDQIGSSHMHSTDGQLCQKQTSGHHVSPFFLNEILSIFSIFVQIPKQREQPALKSPPHLDWLFMLQVTVQG